VFTSWEKEVDKVYPGLDIVCLTSFNEGTPVSLIEAQAANKPIVSTNVGGIENVVIPGRTALLSEISDKEKFFQNLHQLAENDLKRKEMSKEGWKYAGERFSYSSLVMNMSALYHSLLK
jgi:glycosyltransferase involved in cell wall biosynthesis